MNPPQFRWEGHVFEEPDKHVPVKASVKLGENNLVQQIPKVLVSVCELKIELVQIILIVNMVIVLSQEMEAVEFALTSFRLVEHVFEETVRHVLVKVSVKLGEEMLVQQMTQIIVSVCKLKLKLVVVTLIVNVVGVAMEYVIKVEVV